MWRWTNIEKFSFQIHFSEQEDAYGNDMVEVESPDIISFPNFRDELLCMYERLTEEADEEQDRYNIFTDALAEVVEKHNGMWRYAPCAGCVFID